MKIIIVIVREVGYMDKLKPGESYIDIKEELFKLIEEKKEILRILAEK